MNITDTDARRPFQARAWSDLVEDRSNPEMRDLDGWPTKPSHFVKAANPFGEVFRHVWRFATAQEAEALAERVNARIAAAPNWAPGDDHWAEDRPAYGSPAWEKFGEEADLAFELRQDEEARLDDLSRPHRLF